VYDVPDFQLLADAIGQGALPNLQFLSLAHYCMKTGSVKALGLALGKGKCPRLNKVDLRFLFATPVEMVVLLEGIEKGDFKVMRLLDSECWIYPFTSRKTP